MCSGLGWKREGLFPDCGAATAHLEGLEGLLLLDFLHTKMAVDVTPCDTDTPQWC